MMLKAIVWAKENGKKYIYLGSFQLPTDTYKLQFAGLEWFDGQEWKNDLSGLKNYMSKNSLHWHLRRGHERAGHCFPQRRLGG